MATQVTIVPYSPSHPVIRRELAAIHRAARHIRQSPHSARAFLVKHGYLASDGKLAARYR